MYLHTLPFVCVTALVVHWNYLHTFVQEGADLKVDDVYGVGFTNVSSAFTKTVSTLRLMKEGSDINIPYFEQGTASHSTVCDNCQCITMWCKIKQNFIIIRNLYIWLNFYCLLIRKIHVINFVVENHFFICDDLGKGMWLSFFTWLTDMMLPFQQKWIMKFNREFKDKVKM